MEATKVVQFPQVREVYFALPGTEKQVRNALAKYNNAVQRRMVQLHGPYPDPDDIMLEESNELWRRVSEAYCKLVEELEKLPDGERLTDLFEDYVGAHDEYEVHSNRHSYIEGVVDGAFHFKEITEAVWSAAVCGIPE